MRNKRKTKEGQTHIIDESIKKFFPPTSHMGIKSPSRWEQSSSS